MVNVVSASIRKFRKVASLIILGSAALFTLAGYLKLLDLPGFYGALNQMRLLPVGDGNLLAIAIGVPVAKCVLLPLALDRVWRRSVAWIVVSMCFVFSMVHAVLLLARRMPECKYLGILSNYFEARSSSQENIIVLGCVMVLNLVAMLLDGRAHEESGAN